MGKIKAIFQLLQVGSVVADPAKWKKRQITITMLSMLIWAILKLTGYDDAVGGETVDAVAGGILAAVNFVLTITTTEKIGLQRKL